MVLNMKALMRVLPYRIGWSVMQKHRTPTLNTPPITATSKYLCARKTPHTRTHTKRVIITITQAWPALGPRGCVFHPLVFFEVTRCPERVLVAASSGHREGAWARVSL